MIASWSALPKTVMLSGSQILHRNERYLEFIMFAVPGRKRTDTKACAACICITVIDWDFCLECVCKLKGCSKSAEMISCRYETT